MKHLRKKLKNNRGETLVEVLASILIATLSVALLLGCVAASVNLGRQADQGDQYFYQTLTAAENRETPAATEETSPAVQVKEAGVVKAEIPVQVYGGEGLWSYARSAAGGGDP